MVLVVGCGSPIRNDGIIAVASDQDGDWEVYTVSLTTGIALQHTANGTFDSEPTLSPDGIRVAYTTESASLQVDNEGVSENEFPKWDLNEVVSDRNIVITDLTHSEVVVLGLSGVTDDQPAWSPNGRYVAFVSDRTSKAEIFIADPSGEEVRQVTDHPGNNWDPSWSPDNTTIAFASDRTGDWEIFVVNVISGTTKQLTQSPGTDWNPSWSPDGKHIAFSSARSGNFEIYTIDTDTTNTRQLTDHLSADIEPVWSPDSKQVAFASDRSNVLEIYLMDATGGSVSRLGMEGFPSDWSDVEQ